VPAINSGSADCSRPRRWPGARIFDRGVDGIANGGDVLRPHVVHEIDDAIGINDEPRAVEQGTPDFERRCVKGQRRQMQENIISC